MVEWPEASDDDLERYQRMISQGFSLGACIWQVENLAFGK